MNRSLSKYQKDVFICWAMDWWFIFINACSCIVLPCIAMYNGNWVTGLSLFFISASGFLYFLKVKGQLDLGA